MEGEARTKNQNQILGPVAGSLSAMGAANTVTNDHSHSPQAFKPAPTWRSSKGLISGAYCHLWCLFSDVHRER